MNVRYYIEPATDQPQIYKHDVAESEVEEVLARPGEDRLGSDGARVAKSVFVITAYDLRGKAALAYRRRRRNIRP